MEQKRPQQEKEEAKEITKEYREKLEKVKDDPRSLKNFIGVFLILGAQGNLEAVKNFYNDLKKEGIDLATQPIFFTDGDNQLHRAALSGHPEIVEFIGGLNPALLELKNLHGETPLDYALSLQERHVMTNPEVIEKLMELSEAYESSK